MMNLSLQLTKEDFYHYNYYTTWSAPWNNNKRKLYYLRNIGFSIVGLFLVLYFGGRKFQWVSFTAAAVVLLVFYAFFLPYWIKSNYKKHIKKFCANPDNQHFLAKTELIVSDTGIIEKSSLAETNYGWNSFVKKGENGNYIYLYTTSHQALIFPKRIFPSEQEVNEFKKYISHIR